MSRIPFGAVFCAVVLALAGCKPEGGPPSNHDAGPSMQTPPANLGGLDCDPMVPQECGFPFPSNVYTKVVTASPATGETGLHVNFGATTLPIINTQNIDPSQWNDSDGFSPGGAEMTYLPGATTTGFPGQTTVATSLTTSSPTLLVDTSTNPPSLVPQFSELDATDNVATDQAILIHPVGRLKDATRYLVALQNVVDSNGHAIAPSPTFQALLNGTAAPMISVNGTMETDPSVAARQSLYSSFIIPKLKAAGIDTTKLQIAWDFTTASKQNNVGQLESMYTQALSAMPAGGPSFTITSSVDNPDSMTARRIRGLITVPLFLNDAKAVVDADPLNPDLSTGYIMQRDSNGNPVRNGTGQFEFIVNIPAQATTSGPLPILIQGHGLFSDRSEAMDALDDTYDNFIKLAQDQGYVTVSLDLIGWREPGGDTNTPGQYDNGWPSDWGTYPDTNLENDQIKALGFVSNDAGQFRRMIDRGTQGMLNQLMAVKMMETSFAADSHVMIGPGNASVIDTTHAYYRGDSQGGILGITFMALTHDCLRGFLGEAGMPYSMLVMRSTDFAQFLSALVGNYSSPNPSTASANPAMNVQIVIGAMQMFWDRLEGDGFAPYITGSNTISADTPSHNVLMVDSLADHQVTPLGTYNLALSVGATQIQPGFESIYGITGMDGPITGNAIQEFNWGIMAAPLTDTPPPGTTNDPHDWARQAGPVYLETDHFFKTGMAVDDCDSNAGVNSMTVPTTPTSCVFPNAEP